MIEALFCSIGMPPFKVHVYASSLQLQTRLRVNLVDTNTRYGADNIIAYFDGFERRVCKYCYCCTVVFVFGLDGMYHS